MALTVGELEALLAKVEDKTKTIFVDALGWEPIGDLASAVYELEHEVALVSRSARRHYQHSDARRIE